ncbi:hypothetical protein [Mycobacterium avium]|uniref:hypothetical protein n=1 Tax=Mycobacterium avium TaxID=1764 RepID=UPI0005348E8F|nr:hypothetical protein [Mycobacterium avium]
MIDTVGNQLPPTSPFSRTGKTARASVANMPLRTLVKVAAIVWSAALIVALLVGLPALLTAQGVNINFALVISALSAAGSFTAAAVAVWIATTDRRQRKRERDAANEAQAKLVILELSPA